MTTITFHRSSAGAIITRAIAKPRCLCCHKEHPTVKHPQTWICATCKRGRRVFSANTTEQEAHRG
jgi:hypothetical protein